MMLYLTLASTVGNALSTAGEGREHHVAGMPAIMQTDLMLSYFLKSNSVMYRKHLLEFLQHSASSMPKAYV